ncbi:MAG: alpha/beta fold hydrolase [Pyrinomonadaceae bacterium]
MTGQNANGRAARRDPWVVPVGPNPQAALRLFCFPYAGGTAQVYHAWGRHLPPTVETYAVQLPGRVRRSGEPFVKNLPAMVEAALAALLPYFDRPFAFFGHSMGAMLSFELARRLRRERERGPAQLFLSGQRAPQLPGNARVTYDLPEPLLIEELRRLNGTPAEVLEHSELMGLLIPLLRADFELVQTYVYEPGPPLDCPIVAYGGLEDEEVPPDDLAAWREQTTATFSIQMFPGDHFFLHSSQSLLLGRLSEDLLRLSETLKPAL